MTAQLSRRDELRFLYASDYKTARPWKGCLFNEVNLPLGAFCVDISK